MCTTSMSHCIKVFHYKGKDKADDNDSDDDDDLHCRVGWRRRAVGTVGLIRSVH